jgi:putative methyltransferase (TIGR04325 family)
LRAIGDAAFELPGLRRLAMPLYRRRFQRPFGDDNSYYGVYESFADAEAAAQALSTKFLPPTYDTEAAGRAYRNQLERIRVSDYPLVHWLSKLLSGGRRRIFDLGGNIGVSYYGFGRYIDYPADLHWQVHDVPAVMAAGRKWAAQHDPQQRIAFADSPDYADGADVLLSTGALQYLDYTLPQLLQRLSQPPPHVLVNLTPVHPTRGYFTLQNLTFAICPYRVMARPELVAGMESLGYRIIDEWNSRERGLKVPFEPACTIDNYSGFHFQRGG